MELYLLAESADTYRLFLPWSFNLASGGLKEERSPQDERSTPDPDLFDGGERVRNPAQLSIRRAPPCSPQSVAAD
jgi:hypothetical protein